MFGLSWLKLLGLGAALAAVVALVLTVRGHFKDDATTRAKLDKTEKLLAGWVAYGNGEKAAFKESERLRGVEKGEARKAVDAADLACDARVKEARRSAQAIRALINEPPKLSPLGCPVRGAAGLLDSNSVRDSIGARPASPGGR